MQEKGYLLFFFFFFLVWSNNKNEKKFSLGTPGRGYLSAFKEDSMILREKKAYWNIKKNTQFLC